MNICKVSSEKACVTINLKKILSLEKNNKVLKYLLAEKELEEKLKDDLLEIVN